MVRFLCIFFFKAPKEEVQMTNIIGNDGLFEKVWGSKDGGHLVCMGDCKLTFLQRNRSESLLSQVRHIQKVKLSQIVGPVLKHSSFGGKMGKMNPTGRIWQ